MKKATLFLLAVLLGTVVWLLTFYENIEENQETTEGFDSERGDGSNHGKGQKLRVDDKSRMLLEIEKSLGRPLTQDELRIKPAEASWSDWVYFLGLHEVKKMKNGDIQFFGRVVDPEGKPLEGVRIEGHVHYYLESLEEALKQQIARKEQSKDIAIFVISDQNGNFSITEGRGSDITFTRFKKVGWKLTGPKNYRSYIFEPTVLRAHRGDPNKPVEIVLEPVQER